MKKKLKGKWSGRGDSNPRLQLGKLSYYPYTTAAHSAKLRNLNRTYLNSFTIQSAGQMTQFIDAAPEQCADAAYQPFKELEAANPASAETGHFELLGIPR